MHAPSGGVQIPQLALQHTMPGAHVASPHFTPAGALADGAALAEGAVATGSIVADAVVAGAGSRPTSFGALRVVHATRRSSDDAMTRVFMQAPKVPRAVWPGSS